MIRIKDLKEGDIVTLYIPDRRESGKRVLILKKRMQILRLYKHYILFQNNIGIRTCFSYLETRTLMQKGGKTTDDI